MYVRENKCYLQDLNFLEILHKTTEYFVTIQKYIYIYICNKRP